MEKKVLILVFSGFLFFAAAAPAAQMGLDGEDAYTEREYLRYQLELASRVLEDISDTFAEFSQTDIEANAALEKIDLLSHKYEREMSYVAREGQKLHALMRSLISQVEKYLIVFKNTDREDPEINARIIGVKSEINREMVRLHYIAE